MSDIIRLAVIAGIFALALTGWAGGGYAGAAVGLTAGLALLAAPWRGRQLWSWAGLWLRRNRPFSLADPAPAANDRSGGGVRYQDGVAVAAVQLLGKPHQPTYLTGSAAAATANTVDVAELFPLLRQSLGLTVESLSVVSAGARRRATGDYPRVYDTLIGPPPYAGRRETWLVIRIRALDNGGALRCRSTVGAATLAAAQRIAMALRCDGVRARVASATDIVALERRLGRAALAPRNRRWNSARGDSGWLTTYAYRPADIGAEALSRAWSLRADGVIQNVTLYPDGQASATVTVRTSQPPTAPPSVALRTLPGEQAQAIAANLCCPRPDMRRLGRGPLRQPVVIPVGPSGVLIGKTADGNRLLMPLGDPGEPSRVHIAAEDAIAKRIVIRAAAAGERVTVHSTDLPRWDTVRMPDVAVTEQPRPAPGTTVSVTDATVPPAPRPNTVISVGDPGAANTGPADVVITQIGPTTVEVSAGGARHEVEVEFFRAENLYVARGPVALVPELEMAD